MTMTDYSLLLDKLREQRARPAWRPEEDRVLLEEADAIFETLSEADQEAARLQSPARSLTPLWWRTSTARRPIQRLGLSARRVL